MQPQSAKRALLITIVISSALVAFSRGNSQEKTRRFIGLGGLFLGAAVAVEAAPALGAAIALLITTSLALRHGTEALNSARGLTERKWKPMVSEPSVIPASSTFSQPYLPGDPPVTPDSGGSSGGSGKIIGTPYAGTHRLGNWESDNALDLDLASGTPIYSPVNGKIGNDRKFGQFDSRPRFKGMRLYVHGNLGDAFFLSHLRSYASGLRQGQSVRQGQLIAYSGDANGVEHLHFAARPPFSPYGYYKRVFHQR